VEQPQYTTPAAGAEVLPGTEQVEFLIEECLGQLYATEHACPRFLGAALDYDVGCRLLEARTALRAALALLSPTEAV
jgi:hypothetical protein